MSTFDSILVSKFHSEYLNLINRYKDLRRNSIFCRYYNINENSSSELNTVTFNKFSNYDVYDYTPLFRIDQVTDTSQDAPDKSGLKFEAEFSLNTYTITTPRINDILIFPYEANNKNLIYRVKSITALINSLIENIKFYTLNLEYASITDINSLKLSNRYVYLITEGINVTQKFYIDFLNNLTTIKKYLSNSEFDESLELYSEFNENDNSNIFQFLNKYDNYFYNIKKPFYCLNKEFELTNSNNELIKLINKVKVDIQNANI